MRPQHAIIPSSTVSLLFFSSVVAIFLGIWAVIIGYVFHSIEPEFRLKTEFFDTPSSMAPAMEGKTGMIPCRNISLGVESKTFSGDTYLGIVCPVSNNPCISTICGMDGVCRTEPAEPDGCYQDAMCSNETIGTKCDLETCMCTPATTPECMTDDDCMLISNSMCENVTCDDGRCTRQNLDGVECSSSQDCTSGEVCDSTCSCVSPAVGIVAVEYTPVFTFTDSALDLDNLQNLTANFMDFGNYVKVRIQYIAFANGTSTSDMSFDFSLPSGLLADTSGTAVGMHIVHTTPDSITSDSGTSLAGIGTVATLDSMTATATGANTNPDFTGPTNSEALYTGSIFFEYFKPAS